MTTTLKPEYADIVGQVELGERSIAEVASEKGLAANNATVRLHRAGAALRRRRVEMCGTRPGRGWRSGVSAAGASLQNSSRSFTPF